MWVDDDDVSEYEDTSVPEVEGTLQELIDDTDKIAYCLCSRTIQQHLRDNSRIVEDLEDYRLKTLGPVAERMKDWSFDPDEEITAKWEEKMKDYVENDPDPSEHIKKVVESMCADVKLCAKHMAEAAYNSPERIWDPFNNYAWPGYEYKGDGTDSGPEPEEDLEER